jgi:hypothetical protein
VLGTRLVMQTALEESAFQPTNAYELTKMLG